MQLKTALQTTRPSFLILTPICVFLGLSISLTSQAPINYIVFFWILIGSLSAHISVNTLNEYYDFKSGLDLKTQRTPFSGGSGALPSNGGMAKVILIIGLVTLMLTIGIGIYLMLVGGLKILPIGIVGVALIITYTQWLNRSPLLCLIAPGLGFGVLMVVGTHLILTGEHTPLTWLVSLVPFFLINNLLLLNQYPDITADASVGRNTFPIAFGLQKSNVVYGVSMMLAYSLIVLFIVKGYIPSLSLIALAPMLFSLISLIGAIKYSSKIGDHPLFLAMNVAAAILTPLLLGIAILNG
ncbi:MAG: prenyltransferase [Colwellia sp.]